MILGHGGQLQWIGYAGGKPREEWFVKDALQGTRKAPNEPSGHVGECLVPRPSPRPFQCVSFSTSPSRVARLSLEGSVWSTALLQHSP